MQKENNIQQKTVPFKEKIAYGLGDVGNNFLFEMGQIFLLILYTDSLKLPPVTAGLVFLVTKIWDAFADISIGTWIDNRKNIGKRGKFRPFMLYAAVPLALMTVVSFTTPNFSLTGRTIWAFATYMTFGTVYSIFNIPYGSMIPAMTRDVVERADLASLRWAGATTGLLLTQVGFLHIAALFDSMQTGFMVAAATFALAGLGLQLYCYANVKERYTVVKPKIEKGAILKDYKSLFKNTPLLVLCLVNLLTFSAFNVKLGVQVYFCQYTLHNKLIASTTGGFAFGCTYIGILLVPVLVRRYGKKATYILGAAIWAVADLLAWFFANTQVTFIFFACLAFFGTSFINTLNWALISDVVEYGEWKTGNRSEGLIYSSFTFFRKLSQAIAGFVPGIVLAWVGYVANTEQTPRALEGIRGLIFIYPSVLAIVTFIVMYFSYKLTDSRAKEIIAELNERRLEKN